MLLRNLTAEQFAALPENLKGAYRTNAVGTYDLDLTPGLHVVDQDPAALLNSKNHVVTENNELKARIAAMEQSTTEAETKAIADAAKKSGDFEAYRTQMDAQQQQTQAKFEAQMKTRDDAMAKQTLEAAAMKIATEVSGPNAHLAVGVIASQMRCEIVDGMPTIQVVDGFNNVMLGQTVETLKQSFLDNPQNNAIIQQSNGSGGSTPGNKPASTVLTDNKKFSEYSSGELAAINKSHPEEYEKLSQAHKNAQSSQAFGSRIKI